MGYYEHNKFTQHKGEKMKKTKYPLCYGVCNNRTSLGGSDVRLMISIPLSRFKKTDGCIDRGNALDFTDNDIGKKFRMEMLDPVQSGIVTYLGNIFDAIPEGKFKKSLTPLQVDFDKHHLRWRVFKKNGKNACIIIIAAYKCHVTPV